MKGRISRFRPDAWDIAACLYADEADRHGQMVLPA
jgi:hypothetical protein